MMEAKRRPPEGYHPSEGQGRPTGACRDRVGDPCVKYYPTKGVMLQASTVPGNPSGVGGGKRGKIQGWSKASRRRMRYTLLTHTMPESHCFGVSLTLPGPVQSPELCKEIFGKWARVVDKRGWSAVWRVEVQSRGALHWHTVTYVPKAYETNLELGAARSLNRIRARLREDIRETWEGVLRDLGPFEFMPPAPCGRTMKIDHVDNLMCWPGAVDHATDVQDHGNAGNWLRYLQDHATKAKQEQIGVGIGRHWGVIGRKRFVVEEAATGDEMSRAAFDKFLRAYQRMCTPRVPAPGAPFGRRLGYRIRRGNRGNSVWFSKVETVQRLASWAIAETVEPPAAPKMFDPSRFNTRGKS